MTPLSQQDKRWAKQLLGDSQVTVGQYGCTITAIAMYLGTTPDVVNVRLKQVNGFANGNLVIWAKVAEAFPGVYIEEPYIRAYNNEEVLQNLPCLVEVDFDGTPRTDDRHWVLFIGNKRLLDPWTGTERPTSTYPVVSYRAIKGVWKEKEDPVNSQLQQQIQATSECQRQLSTALEQVSNLQSQVDSYISQVEGYKVLTNDLEKKYADEQKLVLSLRGEVENLQKQDKDYGQETLDAQHLAKERVDFLHRIGEKMNIQYDPTDDKKLVESILSEIATLQRQQQIAASQDASNLQQILKLLEQMGINKYLEAKGVRPISTEGIDPQLIEKVQSYLSDVTSELLGVAPKASPVVESVQKKSFLDHLWPLLKYFVTK